MEQTHKRRLAVRIYHLAEVSQEEWRSLLPRYRRENKIWWLVPTPVWCLLLVAAAAAVLYEGGALPLRLLGLTIGLLAAWRIGTRHAQTDSFQFGYDLGRWDGVCRALEVPEGGREELYFLARGLIYEMESEGDDPSSDMYRPLPAGICRQSSASPS